MSLVEILVTVFVLAVGLLAVIRILIPGLAVLPRTNMEAKAMQAASAVAKTAENGAGFRPDAIAYGVPTDPQVAEAGWVVYHDVSMGDVDQIALARSTAGNLVPHYPNLVVGEIIEVPMSLQVAMLECGPYVQGTLKAYYPEPYTQLPDGTDPDDGDSTTNARRFSYDVGSSTIRLDGTDEFDRMTTFMVCHSVDVGGVLYDIVGEEIGFPDPTDLTYLSLVPYGGGAVVPNSITLYEMAPGVENDATHADMGRGGYVLFNNGAPAPGTRLACTYEMQPHVRDGFDDISLTTFPQEQELRNIAVPDIQHYDTYVPLNATDGERWIKLPVETVVRTDADGTVALDDLDPVDGAEENVRVVNRLTGAIGRPEVPPMRGLVLLEEDGEGNLIRGTAGKDGTVRLDANDGAFPPGCPVRIYYRVPNNWALERHVAAANYSFLDMNGIVYGTPTFVPESSRGLKQFWYSVSTDTAGYWTLTLYNNPSGRTEDYWDPASPGPLVLPEEDGHRISVDYRYTDSAGDVQRVTGETHLVDFVSHGFTLHQPNVFAIDAVRGASYKVRVCFDGLDGKRRRVDVDTVVMR